MANNKKSVRSVAKECSCISSYLNSINLLIPPDDNKNIYCFRGQAVSNWKISSSLFRFGKTRDEAKGIYKEVIRNFSDDFSTFEKLTFDDLAKMQHYSIPTDLIDVTFNPLVAMFFATEYGKGKKGTKSGAVYVFKIPKEFEKYKTNDLVFGSTTSHSEKHSAENYLVKTNFSSERIKRQDGAFIYAPELENRDWIIHCFIIQNSSKEKIRKELARLNVSYATLFPELSEFYREINIRFKN